MKKLNKELIIRKNEGSIGQLVSILYRSSQSYIGKKLEPYEVGSGQYSFLAELFHMEGRNQDELASFFRCDKATAARALKTLESRGYVERIRSEDDARVNRVYLTNKAREFYPILSKILSGWTEALTQGFSSEERNLTFDLLTRLVENASTAIDKKDYE